MTIWKKTGQLQQTSKTLILGALDPVGVTITKIAKLDGRNVQDIEPCITNFQITQKQVERRTKDMNYAGDNYILVSNLKTMLGKFFKE